MRILSTSNYTSHSLHLLHNHGRGSKNRMQQSPWSKSQDGGSFSINDGCVFCYCGVKTKVRIFKTDLNPQRPWYGCYLPKNHPKNCNYFLWVGDEDEGITDEGNSRGRKDEEARALKGILMKNKDVTGELRVFKKVVLKSDAVIKVIMLKKEGVTQELRMLKGCVLGTVLFVLLILFFLIFSWVCDVMM